MEQTLFDASFGPREESADLRHAPSLVALMKIPGVGAARAIKIAESFGSWDALLDAPPATRKAAARVDIFFVERPRFVETGNDVRLVGWFDDEYPNALRTIKSPPAVLWVRGVLPDPASRLAIVGSRSTTEWGVSTATYVARGAASKGISVVSGLALGIDIAAHRAVLDAGGATIAVLGGGVDRPTPKEHASDAQRIIDAGGALISEQPAGTSPSPRSLVARNRIQTGLSAATVVVQCGHESGTMTTAKFAMEQGRTVAVTIPTDAQEQAAENNAGSLSLALGDGGDAISLRSHYDVVNLLEELGEQ